MDACYPDEYTRSPREKIKKVLVNVCKKVDTHAVVAVASKQRPDKPVHSSILRIWVFGSFARGASFCGDLDLIIETTVDGHHHGRELAAKTVKAVIGRKQRVHIVYGTPTDNNNDLVFSEAVLVWERDCRIPWTTRIALIKENPAAHRQPRKADVVPFRRDVLSPPEYEDHYYDQLKLLVDSQQLTSTFRPLSTLEVVTDAELAACWPIHAFNASLARKKLIPMGLKYLLNKCREFSLPPAPAQWYTDVMMMHGFQIWLAPQEAPGLSDFIMGRAFSIAILPTLTKTGPNGIWELQLGPQHPQLQQLAGITAWHVAPTAENVAFIQLESTDVQNPHASALMLDLSFSPTCELDDLADVAQTYCEDALPGEVGYAKIKLSGLSLLAQGYAADVVTLPAAGTHCALTSDGKNSTHVLDTVEKSDPPTHLCMQHYDAPRSESFIRYLTAKAD